MQIQPVQIVSLENLFSFHDLGHSLGKIANSAQHYGTEAYKDAKIGGHFAGQAAQHYGTGAYKDAKIGGHFAGQAAPVIAALAGDKYGAYAAQIGQYADDTPVYGLNLQDLHHHHRFSLRHLGHTLGHDLSKAAHTVEHIGEVAYKDGKIAGHLAGKASKIIGVIGGPEAAAAAATLGAIADHLPLQNLQNADLQDLKFSFGHLGQSMDHALHSAEHVASKVGQEVAKDGYAAGKFAVQHAPEIYKGAKITGQYVGKAAPVIAALAGDKYGNYAQTTGQISGNMPLVNLNQQQVYLI